MKWDLKRDWIDALRSGKFKQTTGVLKDEHGYCCMGVLVICMGEKFKKQGGIASVNYFHIREDDMSTYDLSSELLDEAGLTLTNQDILTNKNDSGESFEQIADWIEDEIRGEL